MKVAKLYRYPVKSMGGECVKKAMVTPIGIAGDRQYAIIDVETGHIASAKSPRKWGNMLRFSARYLEEPGLDGSAAAIEICFPDGSRMSSEHPSIDAKLSKAFGRQLRLSYQLRDRPHSELIWRVVEGQEATEWTERRKVRIDGADDVILFELGGAVPKLEGHHNFLDLAPVHVLTTSTLRQLSYLSNGLDFNHRRYRPNILLDTTQNGFVEQEWINKTLSFEKLAMIALMPTPRCVMTTLAQDNLPVSRLTLRSIVRHNTLELDQMPGRWACAGIYANPCQFGELSVDDQVKVTSSSPLVLQAMKDSWAAASASPRAGQMAM